ncbi:metalloproteinase inhibitor 1 [Alligator sinensis]|uniref:Metalloproteinase inhibitor 1 n=1 Tax=Alligator sinensis TaxID=38654 RepID=A0A1U7SEP8_ALLSI|nr:metalloproteinase inhibitor 1 [Alligator sinensis]
MAADAPTQWVPLLAGLALLLARGSPTSACSCAPQHPQSAYCQADLVLRARFMGLSQASSNASASYVRYEIKTSKVLKGPVSGQDLRYLETPTLESLCGYQHAAPLRGEEYVVAASFEDGRATVTSCSFIQPWAELSLGQHRGLMQAYEKGCHCQVLPCQALPCTVTSDSQCLWMDRLSGHGWQGTQAQRFACLPHSRSPPGPTPGLPLCTWQLLKARGALPAHQ